MYFKLDNEKNVVQCDPEEGIALWSGIKERVVRQNVIRDFEISTVFLVIDHSLSFGVHSEPILFETMVFLKGTYADLYCKRYRTWKEALQGHRTVMRYIVKMYRAHENIGPETARESLLTWEMDEDI